MWYLLILMILILVALQILKRRHFQSRFLTPLGAQQHPASKNQYATLQHLSKSQKLLISTRPTQCRLRRTKEIQHALEHCDYNTAEALLNCAINQDPEHEELYIALLDLHLAQNNDIAIEKLFRHIQQLNQLQLLQKAHDRYYAALGHALHFSTQSQQDRFVGPQPQPNSTEAHDKITNN